MELCFIWTMGKSNCRFCSLVGLPRVDGKVPSGGVGDPATAVVLLAVAADAQHAAPADEVAPRHCKMNGLVFSDINTNFDSSNFCDILTFCHFRAIFQDMFAKDCNSHTKEIR